MTLSEIIARLEAATGPDGFLDADIADAVGFNPGCSSAPPYTASIDAAVTLVPPNHDWSLHCDNGEAIAGCMPASEDGCDTSDCHAPTPALAICIAAFHARSAP